jgi:maltose alpha-D-glucosyltransferase / alpha-amylase
VLYYGDEIGMGDNIYLGDRNGVRTPMQWSSDRNAGFSKANPQQLYLPVIVDPEYNYETVNVEAEERNPHSLLWWTRRLIALRKRYRAFSRGTIEFLRPSNRKVLAYLRHHDDEDILVVANLSRYVQYVELDLARFRGKVAVELFGGTRFPPIGDLPYLLTLGPHAFYWFALRPAERDEVRWAPATHVPERIDVGGSWQTMLDEGDAELTTALGAWMVERRWYGGKARRVKDISIAESVPIPGTSEVDATVTIVRVEYVDGTPERYVVPLALATGELAQEIEHHGSRALIARVTRTNGKGRENGIIFDATASPDVCRELLTAMERRRRWRGGAGDGTVQGGRTKAFGRLAGDHPSDLRPEIAPWEQSNTSVLFGDDLILKLFRRIDEGVNPDLEIGRFLTEKAGFPNTAHIAGYIELARPNRDPATLAILQERVRNEGDAWRYTLDEIERFFERALSNEWKTVQPPEGSVLELTNHSPPERVDDLLGEYQEQARLLGRRSAELHIALASDDATPELAPEPFSKLYQRSLYQSMRNLATRVFHDLRQEVDNLDGDVADRAAKLIDAEPRVLDLFRQVADRRVDAMRIRTHGDYHLGQVLYTGRDFVIIDFEGEPARPLGERRIKRSPLADVAGMLRSFDYAPATVFATRVAGGMVSVEDAPQAKPLTRVWRSWISSAFLGAYLERAKGATFLPDNTEDIDLLLNAFLLEKALYEVGYELNNRPDWVWIPIEGVLRLVETMSG